MDNLIFDYYYGQEAEQFSFYRIPRILIKDKHFVSLSSDAKILYGLMLDRMSLSVKNEWQDEQDRTYILYTVENIMEDLNCSKSKAIRVMNELDKDGGIGLIEKKRRGLGKPDLIYVMNFIGVRREFDEKDNDETSENIEKKAETPSKCAEVSKMDFKKYQNETSRSIKNGLQEVSEMDFKKYQNETSRSIENGLQEVSEMDFKKYQNKTSVGIKDELQEVSNIDPNNNNINYTNVNYTDSINHSINECAATTLDDKMDMMDMMGEYREYVRDLIDYSELVSDHKVDKSRIDELIEIMVEVFVAPKNTIYYVGGQERTQGMVQSRFECYNYSIMEYVLLCLDNNTNKVRNIKAYLFTTLYNAPATINSYYKAEVNSMLIGQ